MATALDRYGNQRAIALIPGALFAVLAGMLGVLGALVVEYNVALLLKGVGGLFNVVGMMCLGLGFTDDPVEADDRYVPTIRK